jgi:deoxyribonuclease V
MRMANRFLDVAEVAFFADLQRILSGKKCPFPRNVSRICAVDAAYRGDHVVAVATVFEGKRLVETSSYVGACSIPYISGLFYLREGPFVVQAVRGLEAHPQLICFDAHGAAHPRSAGLATVCGIVLGIPSVGIAKSLLVGKVVRAGGDLDRIVYNERTVGFVTGAGGRTRYWSTGYSISLRGLENLIIRHGNVCLRAMSESDRTARELVQAATMSHPSSRKA